MGDITSWRGVPPTSFLLEVAKGNVPGHSIVHKFGRNDTVPNGSWEMLTQLSGATAFLSAPTAVRIKSGGNAADTAAGAGAREVTVEGLSSALVDATETIATLGSSASGSTTTTFWRVYRAWVSNVGTYGGANTGDVLVEVAGGGTDLAMIAADEGQTQHGSFTIPQGSTGYLMGVLITVDAGKAANVRMMSRGDMTDTSAPMSPTRVKLFFDGILGVLSYTPSATVNVLPALTDVWFEGYGNGSGTAVSVDFGILLVEDGY